MRYPEWASGTRMNSGFPEPQIVGVFARGGESMRAAIYATKSASAGNTYFCLWCRSFDEQVIEISNPADLAAESGFSGERAVYTWRQRMKSLKTLGFIDCRAGSHDYQFVLLLNPHKVLKKIKRDVPDSLYTQLFNRALDVGAKDMTEDADELIDQFED
jgi:hypothetical protein